MSDFISKFEDLLVQLRRRGFKTTTEYINYLFTDLQSHSERANVMFKFYGVR